jgi:hypothetical protein
VRVYYNEIVGKETGKCFGQPEKSHKRLTYRQIDFSPRVRGHGKEPVDASRFQSLFSPSPGEVKRTWVSHPVHLVHGRDYVFAFSHRAGNRYPIDVLLPAGG